MKKTISMIGIFLCAAVILSISVTVYDSRAVENQSITIAYSGCVLGYLEPCG